MWQKNYFRTVILTVHLAIIVCQVNGQINEKALAAAFKIGAAGLPAFERLHCYKEVTNDKVASVSRVTSFGKTNGSPIEIPVGDQDFTITMNKGEIQRFWTLTGVSRTFNGIGIAYYPVDDANYVSQYLKISNLVHYLYAISGSVSVYAFYFDISIDAAAPDKELKGSITTVFLSGTTAVGGYERKNVIMKIAGGGSTVSANFIGTPTTGSAPLTVQFTDQSAGNITSHLWNFGDGQTSTATNPAHVYANNGKYTVSLTVSGPGGSHTKTWPDYIVVASKTSAMVNLTFHCDMTIEIFSKRFNPATDRLSVRGSFNNWSNLDLMQPIATNAPVYAIAVRKFWSIGDTIQYKFAYETARGTSWENDANRRYVLTPANINTESGEVKRPFNDLDSTKVTAQPATVKFAVDIKNAVDVNGRVFSSIQNVILAGNTSPLQWPGNGWPDSDRDKVIFLNDGGTDGDEKASDGVWSKNIVFPKFTALRMEYLYGANWGLPSNNGNNANESVYAKNHLLALTPDLLSATVRNKFGVMGETPLVDVVRKKFPTISLSPQTVNIGAVAVNTEKQFFVMLSNTGNADLIVTNITRTSGTEEFSLKYPIPFPVTIRQNDLARSLIFAFTPKSPGRKEAEFTVYSNDSTNPAYLLRFVGDVITGIASDQSQAHPLTYELFQNHPNPFNPETMIKYQIPRATHVVIEILNTLGKRIALLVDQRQPVGAYAVSWNGRDHFGRNVTSGVYLYRLQTEGFVQVRKLMLIR